MTLPHDIAVGEIECVANVGALLGESPVWDHSAMTLVWTDIKGRKIFRYSPGTQECETFHVEQMVSALAMRQSGGFVAAGQHGFSFLSFEKGRVIGENVANPEWDTPHNRFNDGKVDPLGGFGPGPWMMQRKGFQGLGGGFHLPERSSN